MRSGALTHHCLCRCRCPAQGRTCCRSPREGHGAQHVLQLAVHRSQLRDLQLHADLSPTRPLSLQCYLDAKGTGSRQQCLQLRAALSRHCPRLCCCPRGHVDLCRRTRQVEKREGRRRKWIGVEGRHVTALLFLNHTVAKRRYLVALNHGSQRDTLN